MVLRGQQSATKMLARGGVCCYAADKALAANTATAAFTAYAAINDTLVLDVLGVFR
jgi:hypothetical protein